MKKISLPILISLLIATSVTANEKINSETLQVGYNFDSNGSSSTIHSEGVSSSVGSSSGELKVITGNKQTISCRLITRDQSVAVGETCRTRRRGGRNDNVWTECGPEYKIIKLPYAVQCS